MSEIKKLITHQHVGNIIKTAFASVALLMLLPDATYACSFNCSNKTYTKKHSFGSIINVEVTTYVASKEVKKDLSLKLWDPKPRMDKSSSCLKTQYWDDADMKFDKTAQGYHWPNFPNGASRFASENLLMLNHIVGAQFPPTKDGKDPNIKEKQVVQILKQRLLKAANDNAFTKLNWERKVGSSPSFVTAVTVKSISFAISALNEVGALSEQEFKEIDDWSLKLKKNMTQTKRGAGSLSPDHMVAVFSAHILYGAASKNRELFDIGRTEFEAYLKKVSISGVGDKIRNDNEVMHHAIIAAEILELNGIPAYDFKLKDGTFDEAVSRHASNVIDLGYKEVKTQGDLKDKARTIMRKSGYGTHVAWIPVYLSRQNDSPNAGPVKQLDQVVRSRDPNLYFGLQIGLHTDCYFGSGLQ